jgi:hypothetical protein
MPPLGYDRQEPVGGQTEIEVDGRKEEEAESLLQNKVGHVAGFRKAGEDQKNVQGYGQYGEQHTRRHGHKHVVAGHFAALVCKNTRSSGMAYFAST